MQPSATPVLYIGNRNYSSWSLRAWLALRLMSFAFREHRLLLDTPQFGAQIRAVSGAARVPALRLDDGFVVWDSLAICEYAAEQCAADRVLAGWPPGVRPRAHARAAVAEMHSGFRALRAALPMNIRARRRLAIEPAVRADIERLGQLWREALALGGGGPGLYGAHGIADAFFAPVVLRLQTYGVAYPADCADWAASLLRLGPMQDWCRAAGDEPEVLAAEEVGEPDPA